MVVAATTVGVKLDDRSVEAAQAMAKALELPLITLATQHYEEELKGKLLPGGSEDQNELIHLPQDSLDTILENIQEQDLVLLPSMGSRNRFRSSRGRLPNELLQEWSGSTMIIHFP